MKLGRIFRSRSYPDRMEQKPKDNTLFKKRSVSFENLAGKLFRAGGSIRQLSRMSSQEDSSGYFSASQSSSPRSSTGEMAVMGEDVEKTFQNSIIADAHGISCKVDTQDGMSLHLNQDSKGVAASVCNYPNSPVSTKGNISNQFCLDLNRMKYGFVDEAKNHKFDLGGTVSVTRDQELLHGFKKSLKQIKSLLQGEKNSLKRTMTQYLQHEKARQEKLTKQEKVPLELQKKLQELSREINSINAMVKKADIASEDFSKESRSYWQNTVENDQKCEEACLDACEAVGELFSYAKKEGIIDDKTFHTMNSSSENLIHYMVNPRERLRQMRGTLDKTVQKLDTLIDSAKKISKENLAPAITKMEDFKAQAIKLKSEDYDSLEQGEEIRQINLNLQESHALLEAAKDEIFSAGRKEVSVKEKIAQEFFKDLCSESPESAKFVSQIASQQLLSVQSLVLQTALSIAGSSEQGNGFSRVLSGTMPNAPHSGTILLSKCKDGSIKLEAILNQISAVREEENGEGTVLNDLKKESSGKFLLTIDKERLKDIVAPLQDGQWKFNPNAINFSNCQVDLHLDGDKV